MSVKTAIRKLGRAFRAQDANAFDDGLEELEEAVEKESNDEGGSGAGGDPDTIEVHNHIPDRMFDTALGELPPKEGAEKTFDSEEPPWFKDFKESNDKAMKAMRDSFEEFTKKEEEPSEDDEEENLEMNDRRINDEPSERQEMAERIKEQEGKKGTDEANREILGELQFEAPPGTGDSKIKRATDSAMFEESFQDTVAKAEVLAPGISLPTFDRAAPPIKTGKALFRLRRTALDLAYNRPETRGVIDQALSGRTFDSKRMPTGQARVLFNATAAAIATGNNKRATDHVSQTQHRGAVTAGIQSVGDINKRNRELYARK